MRDMKSQGSPSPTAVSIAPSAEKVRWGGILFCGAVFIVALNFWIFKAELSSGGANIAGGNPPVPVLLTLMLLLLLRRVFRLTNAELLVFYLSAVFAFLPASLGGVRAFFPSLTTPLY